MINLRIFTLKNQTWVATSSSYLIETIIESFPNLGIKKIIVQITYPVIKEVELALNENTSSMQ